MALREGQFQQGGVPWNKNLGVNPKDIMKRFNTKYVISDNGCWEWRGFINPKTGYGQFWVNGKDMLSHRFSYEMFNGIIPSKLVVDHICKNRKCVNPFHLDLTTRVDNVQRGHNEIANNKLKQFCPDGHPYDSKNTYYTKIGYRHCRKCDQQRGRIKNVKRKEERRLKRFGVA